MTEEKFFEINSAEKNSFIYRKLQKHTRAEKKIIIKQKLKFVKQKQKKQKQNKKKN